VAPVAGEATHEDADLSDVVRSQGRQLGKVDPVGLKSLGMAAASAPMI
jgi:hypothetical protein